MKVLIRILTAPPSTGSQTGFIRWLEPLLGATASQCGMPQQVENGDHAANKFLDIQAFEMDLKCVWHLRAMCIYVCLGARVPKAYKQALYKVLGPCYIPVPPYKGFCLTCLHGPTECTRWKESFFSEV